MSGEHVEPMTGIPDLRGWKAIAAFINLSVRQVQEYATAEPPPGHTPMPVFDSPWGKVAWKHEIQIWAKQRLHSHRVGLVIKRARRVSDGGQAA